MNHKHLSPEVRQANKLNARRKLQQDRQYAEGTEEVLRQIMPRTFKEPTPDHVWADRDRRMAVDETPNMLLLGDPAVPRWMSNK